MHGNLNSWYFYAFIIIASTHFQIQLWQIQSVDDSTNREQIQIKNSFDIQEYN